MSSTTTPRLMPKVERLNSLRVYMPSGRLPAVGGSGDSIAGGTGALACAQPLLFKHRGRYGHTVATRHEQHAGRVRSAFQLRYVNLVNERLFFNLPFVRHFAPRVAQHVCVIAEHVACAFALRLLNECGRVNVADDGGGDNLLADFRDARRLFSGLDANVLRGDHGSRDRREQNHTVRTFREAQAHVFKQHSYCGLWIST